MSGESVGPVCKLNAMGRRVEVRMVQQTGGDDEGSSVSYTVCAG